MRNPVNPLVAKRTPLRPAKVRPVNDERAYLAKRGHAEFDHVPGPGRKSAEYGRDPHIVEHPKPATFSAGLTPGTNVSGKGPIPNGHNPVRDEPIVTHPGRMGGKGLLMSAGLSPDTAALPPLPEGHKSRGQKIRRLEQQLAEVRQHRRELEMKEREVPGGVGVSNRPGSKTQA